MMIGQILAILFIVGMPALLIFSLYKVMERKKKTAKIINEIRPLVENAMTREEVESAWALLREKCTRQVDDRILLTIDVAYKNDFIELETMCFTKIKMLNNFEKKC